MLLCTDRHRGDEIAWQLVLMLNNVRGGGIDRSLIGLIYIHTKRLRGEGMNVRARAESVLSHVRPGEVRFNTRRRFCDQGNRARRSNRRNFIVAGRSEERR